MKMLLLAQHSTAMNFTRGKLQEAGMKMEEEKNFLLSGMPQWRA